MPIPLARGTPSARNRWFDDYIRLVLERDVRDLSKLRLAEQLPALTPEKLSTRDPASLSQFGHLLETFVVGELIREASWLDDVAACGHWRTHDDHEVDLIVERGDGGVLAFEVKSSGQVAAHDMRHLRNLREAIGERLQAGVALYTGSRAYRLEDRLYAMPIDRLWKQS